MDYKRRLGRKVNIRKKSEMSQKSLFTDWQGCRGSVMCSARILKFGKT